LKKSKELRDEVEKNDEVAEKLRTEISKCRVEQAGEQSSGGNACAKPGSEG